MRSPVLTFICAIASLNVLASCGGAAMTGGSQRKEKNDKSNGMSASEPAVVTGAYLTCDYSPSDATPGNDAVACGVIKDGAPVTPNPTNKLAFYRSFNHGPYKKPDKTNTGSGHQAVFVASQTELQKSRFLATLANDYGIDEFSCTKLPCNTQIIPNNKPMFVQLQTTAVWRMDNSVNSVIRTMPIFNYIDPINYCNAAGLPLSGSNPALNFLGFPSVSSTTIQTLPKIYAERNNFSKHKLQNNKYFEHSNGCIIVPLERNTTIASFYADGMSMSGLQIDTDRFDLILQDTLANIALVEAFIRDL